MQEGKPFSAKKYQIKKITPINYGKPPWMKKNLIDFISNFGLDESCQCKVPIIQMHIKYIF